MMGGPCDDEGDLHHDAPFLFESARPDPAQPGFWHELLAGVVELEHQQFCYLCHLCSKHHRWWRTERGPARSRAGRTTAEQPFCPMYHSRVQHIEECCQGHLYAIWPEEIDANQVTALQEWMSRVAATEGWAAAHRFMHERLLEFARKRGLQTRAEVLALFAGPNWVPWEPHGGVGPAPVPPSPVYSPLSESAVASEESCSDNGICLECSDAGEEPEEGEP